MASRMDENLYPSPQNGVYWTLKNRGGWSRYFTMSQITYDEKYVISRESNDPRFWDLFRLAKAEEQFTADLNVAIREYRKEVKGECIDVIRDKLIRAFKKVGWKPNTKQINREVRELQKERKEEKLWLRQQKRKLRERIRETKARAKK